MILGRGAAAAVIAAVAIATPAVRAFVAESASPPRAATSGRPAVATTTSPGADRDDRIATLEARLEEATSEASRWRDECARARLDAAASIDGLRAEYDAALEEGQGVIDSLLREAALREEGDAAISVERDDGGSDDANLEFPSTVEVQNSASGTGDSDAEDVLWFAAEAEKSDGTAEDQKSTGSEVSASLVGNAAAAPAVDDAPEAFSSEEASEEISSEANSTPAEIGFSKEEESDAIRRRAADAEPTGTSLRERLAAMEEADDANGSANGKAPSTAPSPRPGTPRRAPGSGRRIEGVGPRRGAGESSEGTGNGGAPRRTTSLRELALRS